MMKKLVLVGFSLVAVVLLVLGSQTQTQAVLSQTQCKTGYSVEFVRIKEIDYKPGDYWDKPCWVIYADIKNTGDRIPEGWMVGVDGFMYRCSNNHSIGDSCYATTVFTPWESGEVKTVFIIFCDIYHLLIPGKFHINVIISPTLQTHCKVLDNDFFVFLNYIYPHYVNSSASLSLGNESPTEKKQ